MGVWRINRLWSAKIPHKGKLFNSTQSFRPLQAVSGTACNVR
jgi:hypothetical protein